MHNLNVRLLLSFSLVFVLCSCDKKFKDDNFTAYFGGEVSNPTNRYVLFCKDSEVIDTIPLNEDNTFFKTFDSLAPGLYSFKHEPEYQYVYFDKNDSLMVRINSQDFDESIIFCGRGEEKNNFLMELYLKNEDDKNTLFDVFDYDLQKFTQNINSSYQSKEAFYLKKKEELKWSEDFDKYAKASLDFFHYSKKEIYPIVHQMRTGENIDDKLPKEYYDFRNNVDFNNADFTNFSPFVRYLSNMMNNVATDKEFTTVSELDKALEINIKKLNIADTLFKNEKIKNIVLNNIAFTYLLEDQNIVNNKKFLDKYHALSTDKDQHNEIVKIGNAIQSLKTGNPLPDANLIDLDGKVQSVHSIIKKKTVVFFWTKSLESHLTASHKRILEIQKKYPDYDFVAICVDENQEKWKTLLSNYKFSGIKEYRAENFEDLKEKWVVNKIHRTILLDAKGNIDNAFVNLFDSKFEQYLR
ncbi:TlpA family protein disulfide reductase [Flavobacterium soli]|uniref:TlpA family protein disulfide reductase n=1 Tax=Flavobacterium soli TaxID=344881 RepID=UPI00040B637A|nr:thioredoxin-like domain-containing protein [Flavobacterium soli]